LHKSLVCGVGGKARGKGDTALLAKEMLNLLKLKQEKAAAKDAGAEGAKAGGKVIPAAQRRVQKDLKTGIEKNSWCVREVCREALAKAERLMLGAGCLQV
jgi:hypothetical protein